ncbi:hypothetical protein LEP1GSC018_0068 [Leptospira kirschneri str. 2008720114]|nr:hypothetical protein LEP1GSC018_0068 [Leptospira kirschneri str. 2008720114]
MPKFSYIEVKWIFAINSYYEIDNGRWFEKTTKIYNYYSGA